MKALLPITFLCLIALGCASPPKLRSTMNQALLGDRLGFTIEEVRPGYHMLRFGSSLRPGQGLLLSIYVRRQPDDYRKDFALELETAAAVLPTVAETDQAARCAYVDLTVVNRYGVMPPRNKALVGFITIRFTRETLLELRHRKASPMEYSQNWIFVNGLKDQPDSAELLKYSDDSIPRF